MRAVVVIAALAGCGVDVGVAGPWVPVDEIGAPLAVETVAPPAVAIAPSTATSLRVVTYNIDEEDPAITPASVAAAILADPDLAGAGVYLIQEGEQYPGEPTSRVAALAQALGVGYIYVPGHTKGADHTHGLAILSPYPIEDVERMELPMAGPARRIAVSATIAIGARRLHVVNLHLEMLANAATRLAQLRPAVIDLTGPVLVGGDFNMSWVQWTGPHVPVLSGNAATEQAPAVDAYMRALGFDTPAEGCGDTAWANGLGARVDAFYTRGLTAAFGAADHVGPSDHIPLWIDVVLP